jgi:hypothetical protein
MKIQEDYLEKTGGKIQAKRIREEVWLRKEKEQALAERNAFEMKCAEERKREMALRGYIEEATCRRRSRGEAEGRASEGGEESSWLL